MLSENPQRYRLILVSGYQLGSSGKAVCRALTRRYKGVALPLWHYGEIDGRASIGESEAADYKRRYGIDKFLAATLSPTDTARIVAAEFRDELIAMEREERPSYEFKVRSAAREPDENDEDEPTWSDLFTSEVSLDILKRALSKDVVAPIDELPREPTWGELLRARASVNSVWTALNKDVITPLDTLPEQPSWTDLMRAQVNSRTLAMALTKPVVDPVDTIADPTTLSELLRARVSAKNLWKLLTFDVHFDNAA